MRQVKGKRVSPAKVRKRAAVNAPLRTAVHACAHAAADFIRTKPAPRPDGFWRQVATGTVPMWPAVAACAGFYGLTALYGLTAGGYFDNGLNSVTRVARTIASVPGFTIRAVQIEGSKPGSEKAIMAAVGARPGDPILWLDTHQAKLRVERLPYVKSATVLRLLPDVIRVQVEEREPFAIWQNEGRLAVVDAEGVVISGLDQSVAANLPLVVGDGANIHARAFLELLSRHPDLRLRMRAAVRVGDRRWNIRLLNGIDIRLPDDDAEAALRDVAALDRDNGLLARDIAAVDLRIKDRIAIRLSDEAALRRSAVLKSAGQTARRKDGAT